MGHELPNGQLLDAWPEISPSEFFQIQRLARERFGLDLKPGKEKLVEARLLRVVRERGHRTFHDFYQEVIHDRTGESLVALIDALTTNVTGFLRERVHFDYLAGEVIPRLERRPLIPIWSCACATGEEVYSIVFTVADRFGQAVASKLRVLGSDISTRALSHAQQAIYSEERVAVLPLEWLERFFLRGTGQAQGYYKVRDEVRRLVQFRRINLVEPFDSLPQFPVIFCRNVLIYFTPEAFRDCVRRLVDQLEPGGYIMVGLAESLSGVDTRLAYVQPGIYQKVRSSS